jgi:putative PIN family toxin of toxin-antitoxin system
MPTSTRLFVQSVPSVIRVVFDTTVFLRSLINPESRWGKLLHDNANDYQLCVSVEILREILDVVTRPELVRKYRGLAGRDIQKLLAILSVAEVVAPAPIPPTCRDPKDDVFIATAVAARAGFLVSENRDLLDLGRYEEIEIMDTAKFLNILDQ